MAAWTTRTRDLYASLNEILYSRSGFALELNSLLTAPDSPLTGVHIEITQPSGFPSMVLGREAEGQADHLVQVDLDPLGRFLGRCALWFKLGTSREDRRAAQESLPRLVDAWWRAAERDEKGKILSGQFPSLQQALERTVATWVETGPVAVLFGDIDRFKGFNDMHGELEGDRLIAKAAATLVRYAPEEALVVHRSGDEFLIVLPATDSGKLAYDTITLRKKVEEELLDGEIPSSSGPQMGFSLGVATVVDSSVSYADLERRADRALKPGGEKRRGRVSIETSTADVEGFADPTVDLGVAHTLSSLGATSPFSNQWLNLLSTAAAVGAQESTETSSLASSIRSAVEAVGPAWEAASRQAALSANDFPLTGESRLSPVDVACGVAHGLGRASLAGHCAAGSDWTLEYMRDGHAAAIVTRSGVRLATWGETGETTLEERIAITSTIGPISGVVDSRRALLVSIGRDPIQLPPYLFADAVYVDNRPTLGGGLPDLWEAALTQVITTMQRFPNVKGVLIIGDVEYGKETIHRLTTTATWEEPGTADELAYKLGLQTTPIRQVAQRLVGHVVHASDRQQAIRTILQFMSETDTLGPTTDPDVSLRTPPLRRILQMDALLLGPEAGCRVATAYEAFPVALDIVRQSESDVVKDPTGRAFRELVDFRIQLTTPTVDKIPRYHRDDQAAFEAYFQREFVDPTGKFRASLDLHSQLRHVIEHTAEIVRRSGYTSRRALLVVPHVPPADGDLSPLGLVSIRVIPRSTLSGAGVLDYSFSWRTVEVLVGLPYSLYASISFGEYLTDLISKQLDGSQAAALRMGELSYIAHSLHVYVDEYAEKIARRIVNDDTR